MLNRFPCLRQLQNRTSRALVAVIAALLSTGCATNLSQQEAPVAVRDPLESVNRKIFSFNESLDRAVLKPAATAYKQAVPPVVQTGISNFFSNLETPWSSVNLMMQGRVRESVSTAARFGTNTTFGIFGFMDVATHWGMPDRSEDFGLTLDTWGVGSGPFLVLPIFGPSNVRDALASPVDILANAEGQVSNVAVRNSMTAVQIVSQRAEFLGLGDLVDQVALDKYILMRDLHLKRRNRAAHRNQTEEQGSALGDGVTKHE